MGIKVANIKERNNKDWGMYIGKKSIGIIIPTNNDFEKSGEGNSKTPTIKPTKIEKFAFFSLNDFE